MKVLLYGRPGMAAMLSIAAAVAACGAAADVRPSKYFDPTNDPKVEQPDLVLVPSVAPRADLIVSTFGALGVPVLVVPTLDIGELEEGVEDELRSALAIHGLEAPACPDLPPMIIDSDLGDEQPVMTKEDLESLAREALDTTAREAEEASLQRSIADAEARVAAESEAVAPAATRVISGTTTDGAVLSPEAVAALSASLAAAPASVSAEREPAPVNVPPAVAPVAPPKPPAAPKSPAKAASKTTSKTASKAASKTTK